MTAVTNTRKLFIDTKKRFTNTRKCVRFSGNYLSFWIMTAPL